MLSLEAGSAGAILGRHVVVASVVLYRTPMELLRPCLQSLARQHLSGDVRLYLAFMDNDGGSSLAGLDGLLEDLGLTGKVLVRLSGENVGFGRAHNALFKACGSLMGDRAWLHLCVNPDSVYHHRAVGAMVDFAASRDFRGLFEARQFPREHPKPYDEQDFRTPWCSGCALMVPSAVYDSLGGFSDDFFMYCEDVDLSWRARLAGLDCYVVPAAIVHHDVTRKERDDAFERKHLLISGYKIARRFGNAEFGQVMLDTAGQVLQPDEMRRLERWGREAKVLPEAAGQDFADFAHGFHFSKGRW
ncbi:MAG: glycosyltransferase family 2 protein [Candidatus Sericytochromatia bacterium]|nr:glycosyltransferase family 2 protein [Candidatus Sericytochromatia bacterium]